MKKILSKFTLLYFFSSLIGVLFFLWTIIQISDKYKWNWFLPSLFERYGLISWFLISFLFSLIILILRYFFGYQIVQSANEVLSSSSLPIKIKRNNCLIKIKISSGDYQDVNLKNESIRIKVVEIIKKKFKSNLFSDKEEYGVSINVDTGGGLVFGGEETIESDVNQYILPEKNYREEERCSIYCFNISKKEFMFFRTFIEHINPEQKLATLNIFFARSRKIYKI